MSETWNMDDFEVIQEKGTTWEPKQRKDEEGEVVKQKATDKSWIAGYYMGSKENVGNNNSTIHELKLLRQPDGRALVGDPKHLLGDPSETGDLISIWGTGVLDSRIAENVVPGQAIMIKWLGRKKPVKNPTGKPYHVWEVSVNSKITPLDLGHRTASNDSFSDFEDDASDIVPQKTAAAAGGSDDWEDDDDLMG